MKGYFLPLAAAVLAVSLSAPGITAPVVVTTQGELGDLAAAYSTTDLIEGMIATELPGDKGWHPANADPLDKLPAFTDGQGMRPSGLTGLLNDFPGAGTPTKLIQYQFDSPKDIDEIRVFSGNKNNTDGRVFHTYTAEFSPNGIDFTPPIYVQSHPSGTINNDAGIFNHWHNALTQLTDDSGKVAYGVRYLRLKFYSVDNTGGQMRDPFDGENPFTGTDDGLSAGFVSPLILEIDVFGANSVAQPVATIGEARAKPLGMLVSLSDKVVTKSATTEFFMEEANRSAGIRVVSAENPPANQKVSITGQIVTSSTNGEKYLEATGQPATVGAAATVGPLDMRNGVIGGQSATGSAGLATDGLLVTTWGKVTGIDIGNSVVYIDDGSNAANDTPVGTLGEQVAGLKVGPGDVFSLLPGQYVGVTGISRLDAGGLGIIRRVEPLDFGSSIVSLD
ncbi:MAG: hypothetical protein IT209_06120 [Armatimonadetes bacterium]|nr:hypothetical protein [Armatimonadota bacterium]